MLAIKTLLKDEKIDVDLKPSLEGNRIAAWISKQDASHHRTVAGVRS